MNLQIFYYQCYHSGYQQQRGQHWRQKIDQVVADHQFEFSHDFSYELRILVNFITPPNPLLA